MQTRIYLLITLVLLFTSAVHAQNVMINVMARQSGIVKRNGTVFIELTLSNTDPFRSTGAFKLRPQVSVPTNLLTISREGHVLPKGWTVLSNIGNTILFSNGDDIIEATGERTILIAAKANAAGGPSTILALLAFSDGKAPGNTPGQLDDDNTNDNTSTTTIRVND